MFDEKFIPDTMIKDFVNTTNKLKIKLKQRASLPQKYWEGTNTTKALLKFDVK